MLIGEFGSVGYYLITNNLTSTGINGCTELKLDFLETLDNTQKEKQKLASHLQFFSVGV